MPSPLGHSLSGALLYTLLEKPPHPFWQLRKAVPYLIFAAIPDIDFLVVRGGKIVITEEYHHTYSHSLGFGFLVAGVTYGVLWLFREKDRLRQSLLTLVLVALHCFLDMTNHTGHLFMPQGLPLLWPFSQRTFTCSWVILPGVVFGKSPLDPVNLIGVSAEILLFGVLIGIVVFTKKGATAKRWRWISS